MEDGTYIKESTNQFFISKMSTPEKRRQLTRSEQLLRERMRASGVGITEYQYINSFDSNLVNTGNGCALYPCQLNETDQVYIFFVCILIQY